MKLGAGVKNVRERLGDALNKRPLLFGALFAALSALCAEYAGAKAFVIALCVVILLIMCCKVKRLYAVLLAVICVFTFVRAGTLLRHTSALDSYLPAKLDMTLKVVSAVSRDSERVSCVAEIIAVSEIPEYDSCERVLLSVYEPNFELVSGGVYSLYGKLSLPKGARNPGGFDYRRYLLSRSLHYSMYAEPESIKLLRAESLPLSTERVYQLRERWLKLLSDNLSEPSAGLVRGMLFGTDELDEAVQNDFRAISLAHIFAVSGLHMGIIYGFIAFILRRLNVRGIAALFAVGLVLGFYTLLAGLSISALRAALMLLCASASVYFRPLARRGDTLSFLCLASVVFILWQPFCIYSLSFQLSFGAVAGIAVFTKVGKNALLSRVKSEKLRENALVANTAELLCVSFGAQCGSSLIAASVFHSFSPVSLPANMLILPFVGYVVLLSLFALCTSPLPALSRFGFGGAMLLLRYITAAAAAAAALKYASVYVAGVKWYFAVFVYALLLWAFGYIDLKRSGGRIAFFLAAALFALGAADSYALPKLDSVSFLDVGFGDCAVIRTNKNQTALIDGGGGFYGGDTAGEVLLPYFFEENIRTLDVVVATHSDADHIGGILGIIGKIPIGTIYANDDGGVLYDELCRLAEISEIPIKPAFEGDSIALGETTLSVRNPQEDISPKASLNDQSIVISAELSGVSFLFLGDGGKIMEENLLSESPEYFLRTDFVKMAHHGSLYKTDAFLLRFIAKNYIISVGSNGYQLPNAQLLELLEITYDSEYYRTDESGMLRVDISDGEYTITEYLKGEVNGTMP